MNADSAATYDLIIIGAGINGCGIARDAAMRGLKVLLLDKGDIASGTTAGSTRLIHGGLRYLEHGEIGLVRESLVERERLLRIAPHLVRPLNLLIPLYKHGRRGPWTIRAGMVAYDLLSFDKSLANHRMLSRERTLRRAPALRPEGLLGAAMYSDAQVEYAERLTLENAISAKEHGARILTYTRVDRLIVDDHNVKGVAFTNLMGGSSGEALAPVTINVAGPWADQVAGSLERKAEPLIGGTKGSHIVVDQFPDAPKDALYVEAQSDARPIFVIPWNKLFLIGTTDTRYYENLDLVEADQAEIDYLIAEANRVIPAAEFDRDSVLYTYSGVRPLPYVKEGSESAITRRYILHDHSADKSGRLKGLISVVGGKLTTYRNLAEHAVDAIFRKFRGPTPACKTDRVPLPGAHVGDELQAFKLDFERKSGLGKTSADHLVRVYGSRAIELLELAGQDADLKKPVDPETGTIGAEILFSFLGEMAQTLTDVLLRRTMAGLGPRAGIGTDENAAKVCVRYLDWDQARARDEVQAYRDYIKRMHPRSLRQHD
jgi:glycerol-3-phosphate dehydrogenase